MEPPSELEDLLTRMRDGETAARAELFERFYGKVREIVHAQLQHDFRKNKRWILPLFSTGDVVQEVFLGVVGEPLDGFTGSTDAEFVQYLSAIVKHRLIDAVRYHEASRRDARRRIEPTTEAPAAQPVAADATPSIAAAIGEQLSVYAEVVAGLGDKDQQLVKRRLENEESFAEIAAALDLPTDDAARQAFNAAKARLMVRLRAQGMGESS